MIFFFFFFFQYPSGMKFLFLFYEIKSFGAGKLFRLMLAIFRVHEKKFVFCHTWNLLGHECIVFCNSSLNSIGNFLVYEVFFCLHENFAV